MLAPLPSQPVFANNQQQYGQQAYGGMGGYQMAPVQQAVGSDRWDNMNVLFTTIRDHARNFEYPSASVAALETVLIRLYLESPMGVGNPNPNLGHVMAHSHNNRGPAQQQGMAIVGQNPGNEP